MRQACFILAKSLHSKCFSEDRKSCASPAGISSLLHNDETYAIFYPRVTNVVVMIVMIVTIQGKKTSAAFHDMLDSCPSYEASVPHNQFAKGTFDMPPCLTFPLHSHYIPTTFPAFLIPLFVFGSSARIGLLWLL